MKRVLLPALAFLLAACGSSPRTAEPLQTPGTEAPPGAGEPVPPGVSEPPNRIPDETLPAAEATFRAPAQGTVVERRGKSGLGIRASGDVVAVKSGRVSLLQSSWHGYRNLIIVRHADGFRSVYADVDEVLVPMGKAVRQGEALARLKPAGTLHFRLYREGQALDPAAYLP